jgi:hypothetical protein
MTDYRANQELEDALKDIHKGLHVAMTAFIRDRDLDEAELVMRQLDSRLSQVINATKVIR